MQAPFYGRNTNVDQTPAVKLVAAEVQCFSKVTLKAPLANGATTNIIYVGLTSGVTASTGYPLAPGESLELDVGVIKTSPTAPFADLQTIYVIAGGADNLSVSYIGV